MTLKPFFAGLIAAQMVSTMIVGLSNLRLYGQVQAVVQAGFLPVPNTIVLPRLKELLPAMVGGLFFTLTLGVWVSLIWTWIIGRTRNRRILLIACLGCACAANLSGWCPELAAFMIAIPIAVFWSARKHPPKWLDRHTLISILSHGISITLLLIIGSGLMTYQTFFNIRDFFLLTNPAGKVINQLYYDYTLYAAEVFKSLEQKQIKTAEILSTETASDVKQIEAVLLDYDYLIVGHEVKTDLQVEMNRSSVIFQQHGKRVLEIPRHSFFSNPKPTFKSFSEKTDRYKLFRAVTLVSLMTVVVLTTYGLLYLPFRSLFGLRRTVNSLKASLLPILGAFVFGTIVIVIWRSETQPIDAKLLFASLESDSLYKRVYALRMIRDKRIEIGQYPNRERFLNSTCIPERYWYAKTLAVSRIPETYAELLLLLNDPQFNIVYNAMEALGMRGNPAGIEPILKYLQTSNHWYTQWYAYRALKKLGWRQRKSES